MFQGAHLLRFAGCLLLTLSTLVVPALAATGGTAGMEARMVQLVNADRARAGLAPLTSDPSLAAVARAHSSDMVSGGFFSHTSPSTGDPEQRINAAGIGWRAYAENIAYNSSVEEAEASFLQSPGHRMNLLSPTYDTIGIGIVQGARSIFVTQVFIKSRKGASKPRGVVVQPSSREVPVRRKAQRYHIPGF